MRTVFLIAIVFGVSGCPKPQSDTSSGGKGEPGIGAHVKRGGEKRSLQNDISQLFKLMQVYYTEFGNPPKTWKEFQPYIQKEAPHIVRAIEDKEIVVLWGQPFASGVVIAYEREPDLRGTHVVAYGDGSVQTVTAADLQTALKNQRR